MKKSISTAVVAVLLSSVPYSFGATPPAKAQNENTQKPAMAVDQAKVDEMVKGWPARPQLAVKQMVSQYGMPAEANQESIVWKNAGSFKRITVTKNETPHDFPKPHMDFMEHTIAYTIPAHKVGDVAAFDGSVTVDRTQGEMSARCDLESHNILALNTAREILLGKKDVAQARKSFVDTLNEHLQGKHPEMMSKLMFTASTESVAFADQPTIPGAPVRKEAKGDSEVMSVVLAANEGEIIAADVVAKKKVSEEVKGFAQMMHTEHGKNSIDTMALSQKIKIVPTDTQAVDQLKNKSATELAALVGLDGKDFEKAYMDAMVKQHNEVIAMIDGQLIKEAKNEELKKHLTATRGHVMKHLDAAKKIQEGFAAPLAKR